MRRVDQTLAERKCRMALESIRNGYRRRAVAGDSDDNEEAGERSNILRKSPAAVANVIAKRDGDHRLARLVVRPRATNRDDRSSVRTGQCVLATALVRALEDMGDGSRCHGHRPSISRTSVQLRKVLINTRPASRLRLMKDNSCAMVFTISAATSTSRPSNSDRPMRIL